MSIIAPIRVNVNSSPVTPVSGVTGAGSPAFDVELGRQPSLGINAILSVTFSDEGSDYLKEHRNRLYRLQRAASQLFKQDRDEKVIAAGGSPKWADSRMGYHRVCFCHWARWASEVTVTYSEQHKRAVYKGVQVCGSWSACPVCGSKISERRRVELAAAVLEARSRGWVTALGTLTISHRPGESVDDLVSRIYGRLDRLKNMRDYKRLIERYGIEGPGARGGVAKRLYSVNGFDYTWGYQGHHTHLHPLWFLAPGSDVAAFASEMRELWYRAGNGPFVACEATGELVAASMNAWEHGCKVTSNDGDVADYITKFGRLPRWDLDRELTKSAVKRGRGGQGHSKHYTAMELLESYALTGNKLHGRVWMEYAAGMKGRHHLTWSPGLRACLELGEAATDDELAGEVSDLQRDLASLSGDLWHQVCVRGLRSALLAVGDKGSSLAVNVWLAALQERGWDSG